MDREYRYSLCFTLGVEFTTVLLDGREYRYVQDIQVLMGNTGTGREYMYVERGQVWTRSKDTVCASDSSSSPPYSLTTGSTGVRICLKKENKKKLVVGTNKSTNKGTDKVMNRKRNYQRNGQKDYRDIEIERKSAFFLYTYKKTKLRTVKNKRCVNNKKNFFFANK